MDGSGEQPRDGGEAGGRRAGGGQAPPPAGPTIAPVSLEPCDLQALGQKLLDRALPASSPLPPGGGPRLSGFRAPIPCFLTVLYPREAGDPRTQTPGQARACRGHHFLVGGAGLPSAPSGGGSRCMKFP